jgi:hypothetical protein
VGRSLDHLHLPCCSGIRRGKRSKQQTNIRNSRHIIDRTVFARALTLPQIPY